MFGGGVSKQQDLAKLLTYENDLDSLCFESMASTPSWAREPQEALEVDPLAQESGRKDAFGSLNEMLPQKHNNSELKKSGEPVAANKKDRKQRGAQQSVRGALTRRERLASIQKSADCVDQCDRSRNHRSRKKPVEATKRSPAGWNENIPGNVSKTCSNNACEQDLTKVHQVPERQQGFLTSREELVKSKSRGTSGKMTPAGHQKGTENGSCKNISVVGCSSVQNMLQSLFLGAEQDPECSIKRTSIDSEYRGHDRVVGFCTEKRHLRFDDDGNILPHSPGILKLRGLPTPTGTHVRFHR